jgi:hypothetical protein
VADVTIRSVDEMESIWGGSLVRARALPIVELSGPESL